MCVGGDSGDASLLELSNSLVTCTKAEKVDVVGDVDHGDDEQLGHMYKDREGEQHVHSRPIAIQVTMATMLDRESRREKILSAIQKEARLKVRTEDHKAHLEFSSHPCAGQMLELLELEARS